MDSEQEDWCNYSDLPSPLAYVNVPDEERGDCINTFVYLSL
jgi:hypothetical protein